MFDVSEVRADFPVLQRKVHGKELVYLDNAATSQKPEQVIQAMDDWTSSTPAVDDITLLVARSTSSD